jgi:hypothetical protein
MNKQDDLEQRLEVVTTTRATYLGYVQEEGTTYHLTKAMVLPQEATSVSEIALEYYAEKARRNLHDYIVPMTAVESRTYDAHIDRMVQSYTELAKVANRGIYGKAKATRLRKFLKNLGGEK